MGIKLFTLPQEPVQRRTGVALLGMSLASEPMLCVYGMLGVILHKDFGASALQIALLTMLKPLVSLLSFYWGAVVGKGRRLRWHVALTGILGRLPFLCVPFFDSSWFLIGAAAIYMLFARAGIPPWMEVVKRNLKGEERQRLFSLSSALGYAEGVAIALGFGWLLDHKEGIWKLLLVGSAMIGLVGVWLQARVSEGCSEGGKETGAHWIVQPWKDAWALLKQRRDFGRFQVGFALSGFAVMLIQPALPLLFVDVLHLSYMDVAIALSVCKGLGYVVSSPFWGRAMGERSIFALSRWVFGAVGLFGSSERELTDIPIEFYTLEPHREHVFFSDRDQLQASLEDAETLFRTFETAPEPLNRGAAVFVVKGQQLLSLSKEDWISREVHIKEFPGLIHPGRQALMVERYIQEQPSYPFLKAIEEGLITSQGVLFTRYFPSPLMKRMLLGDQVLRCLKGIYFQHPSLSYGDFFSHEDRSFLLDLAKFAIPVYWIDKTSGKVLQYTPKPEKDTGMFVPLRSIDAFLASTSFGIYGSNLLTGDFEKELTKLLEGVLEMRSSMNHPLLHKETSIALVTGGGPGVMELGNRVAKNLGILSCANIVDFRSRAGSVVNEQRQNPEEPPQSFSEPVLAGE